VLGRLLGPPDLTPAQLDAVVRSAATIQSDHSQGVVVDAFLDSGPLSGEELSTVLVLTRGIESDHEHGRILQRVARDEELTGT
jgi:hypothetical protein